MKLLLKINTIMLLLTILLNASIFSKGYKVLKETTKVSSKSISNKALKTSVKKLTQQNKKKTREYQIKSEKEFNSIKKQSHQYKDNQLRRISKLEKNLINSKNPKKIKIHNKTVIKRDIFSCTRDNKKLLLKGLAPLDEKGLKINLHHLKQQETGTIIELTSEEHSQNSKTLHRYTKKSEINRQKFNSFRKKYWKSRSIDCIK